MSLREVQEVARLAADSGASVHGGPTVHKVADALGLPPNEVELLLDQVRQGRSPIRDFKIAAGIAALVAMFLLGVGTTSLVARHAPSQAVAASALPTPPGGTPMSPTSVSNAADPIRATPSSAPVASNEPATQLSAPAGSVEAKTTEGDLLRAVKLARDRSGTLAENGGGDGTGARLMPTTSIAR